MTDDTMRAHEAPSEPTYSDADLAAAEAEEAATPSADPAPDEADTEADELIDPNPPDEAIVAEPRDGADAAPDAEA